ncbi:MAG: aspartyl-tRNA synthetase [Frankiaceae bacterium]|nr:aspartyl-tRNA synthetase [Frankiaceae bacterium]
MIRDQQAGQLRAADAGRTVTLAGWVARRRDHGGVVFIDLRDASGIVQVVFREGDAAETAKSLRAEYCVTITGDVIARPAGNANPDLPTGEVEIVATILTVLSEAAPLPFPIADAPQIDVNVDEITRWKYRYLDLRREGPARALRTRSKITSTIRQVMESHDFLDIETPNLTRSTPEGARDFLVPVRLQPGSWYALPQSPQLFKQLLMVAGLERYYQIARCFRDEDARADRTPEFTQLDIEMSFLDEEDIYALAEDVVGALWQSILGVDLPRPFPRMTYAEAMQRFGSDRPDTRFAIELVELADVFAASEFRVFQADYVGAVVYPGGAELTRKELDGWQEWARSRGAKGLAYLLVDPDGTTRGGVAKNLSEQEIAAVLARSGASAGDAVFFAAGEQRASRELLGAARQEIAKRAGSIPDGLWNFLWVVDFPMFERAGDGEWTSVHHPFTAPTPEWVEEFDKAPGEALSRGYDVVVNGVELGGGSIRIHRSDVQQRVFDTLGLSRAEAESKFGFLLEAFAYGPPPHGGIAFGIDRLAAMLVGTDSIREVMAFPKSTSGGDPLTGAPTPITAQQRKEAHIDWTPPPAKPTE